MLFAKNGAQVVLASSHDFGVGYDNKTNEFQGTPHAIREFNYARKDLNEQLLPPPFQKGPMFSIGERARFKA